MKFFVTNTYHSLSIVVKIKMHQKNYILNVQTYDVMYFKLTVIIVSVEFATADELR